MLIACAGQALRDDAAIAMRIYLALGDSISIEDYTEHDALDVATAVSVAASGCPRVTTAEDPVRRRSVPPAAAALLLIGT